MSEETKSVFVVEGSAKEVEEQLLAAGYPIEATWEEIWQAFVAVCERRSGLAPGKMKNFLGSVACHREHFMEAMEQLSGGVSGAPKTETDE